MSKKGKITAKDVAEMAGVSMMAVSRVLSGKGYSSKELSAKVHKAVTALGYVPNALARGMMAGKTMMVGVPVSVSSPFFSDVVQGIYASLSEFDYLLTLGWAREITPKNSDQSDLRYIQRMLEHRVDGLIIRPTLGPKNEKYYQEVKKRDIPMVCVDRDFDKIACPFVGSDDLWGGEEAARILLERGHRKVLHVAGVQAVSSTAVLRRKGFKGAIEASADTRYYEVVGRNLETDWMDQVVELVKKKKITAVFLYNDHLASMLFSEFEKQNISIPDDVSIIGFGGLPVAEWTRPKLSTFNQKPKIIGKEAGLLLHALMNEKDESFSSKRILIRPEWVEAGSVSSIKS